MVEKEYRLARTDEKTIEKVLLDQNIHYLHMVLPAGDGLPVHHCNAPLYMTVVRGTLSIELDGQPVHEYPSGTLLTIPDRTLMHVRNLHPDTLELIVVKAPAP
ncbi:MAG: cupin domain-containing protein [Eubacteriales bacterium]